ncbi:hypothetical protein ASG89_28375 [Paenibacillus sp. Soil766]|uniref:hypothetical protein n=1 Tax=Paenibacillus sp. Soil766 TaxID=1736404 RepID=UPI00070C3E21|nr:hypothetical protein [Paenibacillus sp. Soil766]KRE98883.1 hypothetical protein ASG89_28375 [Paenibacillus sp. Soil766]
MDGEPWMAEQFEVSWKHLLAVAYRMLGSLSEAEEMETSKEQAIFEFNQRRLKFLSYLSVKRDRQYNLNELVPDDFFV